MTKPSGGSARQRKKMYLAVLALLAAISLRPLLRERDARMPPRPREHDLQHGISPTPSVPGSPEHTLMEGSRFLQGSDQKHGASRIPSVPTSSAPPMAPPEGGAPGEARRRMNVLLVVSDDLRPQSTTFGAAAPETPHLARLAARGLTFTRAFAQATTCNPSRSSFLTGRGPDVIQVRAPILTATLD